MNTMDSDASQQQQEIEPRESTDGKLLVLGPWLRLSKTLWGHTIKHSLSRSLVAWCQSDSFTVCLAFSS